MIKLISLLPLACAISLSSCQLGTKSSKKPTSTPKYNLGKHNNLVDPSAKKITANYANEYNLSGNVIAIYPEFQIRLVSTEIKDDDTISLFEVTSTNGLERDQLRCTTKDPEKQHFYIEDMHFFYHSNTPGKINVYIPQILLAKNHVQSNSTL